jgi:hypothetical protein
VKHGRGDVGTHVPEAVTVLVAVVTQEQYAFFESVYRSDTPSFGKEKISKKKDAFSCPLGRDAPQARV